MRLLLCALLAALLPSCASLAAEPYQRVRFEVVESFDTPGDDLTLEYVSVQGTPLAWGSTLRVRGTYRLASQARAVLYLGLTNGSIEEPQPHRIERGSGTFDLEVRVLRAG